MDLKLGKSVKHKMLMKQFPKFFALPLLFHQELPSYIDIAERAIKELHIKELVTIVHITEHRRITRDCDMPRIGEIRDA